jgi:type 1 glutamine amidotransferase
MRSYFSIVLAALVAGFTASAVHAEPAHKTDVRKKLVLLIAEPEYDTAKTLPAFASQFLEKEFRVVTVTGGAGEEQTGFANFREIADADVLVVSVRRRTPPKEQLDLIRAHVREGKPVVGIRTASHAFALAKGQTLAPGHADWPEWDAEVLGGNYTGHHAKTMPTTVTAAASGDPLLRGVTTPFRSTSWLYKASPLRAGAHVIATGAVEGQPPEPVAWCFTRADKGRTFYTSLGHPDDFREPAFQNLLLNGIRWAAGMR